MFVNLLPSMELQAVRAERERLSQEAAGLIWLRRLVLARRDLEVARLTGAGPWLSAASGLPPAVRHALDDVLSCRCPDLLVQLSQSVRTLTEAVDGTRRDLDSATDELVDRYRREPRLCLTAGPVPIAHGRRPTAVGR